MGYPAYDGSDKPGITVAQPSPRLLCILEAHSAEQAPSAATPLQPDPCFGDQESDSLSLFNGQTDVSAGVWGDRGLGLPGGSFHGLTTILLDAKQHWLKDASVYKVGWGSKSAQTLSEERKGWGSLFGPESSQGDLGWLQTWSVAKGELKLQSFCLCLLSVGTTGTYHHTRVCSAGDQTQSYVHAR